MKNYHVGWAVPVVFTLLVLSAVSRAAESPTFEHDVRPILKAGCFQCHGEQEKLRG